MSILTIGSTNPNFSHIISKNPNTILSSGVPFRRDLRKGNIYGWFSKLDNSEFRLLFRDSELESSFSDRGEIEYLDITRYSSPYIPIQMITTALASANRGSELDVSGFTAYVEVIIEIPARIANRLSFTAPTKVEITNISGAHSKVKVTAETVSQALNLIQIICIVSTLAVDTLYVPMDKIVVFKYLNALNLAGAEYPLRQLFISRAVTNPELFEEANEMGLINTPDIIFQFGNTQRQRFQAIRAALSVTPAPTLLDIGCGELSHALKLSSTYQDILAFDQNIEIQQINSRKLLSRGVKNILLVEMNVTAETWLEATSTVIGEYDVLLSEVLEHMPKEEAGALLKVILDDSEARRVVITVPNGEFNQFYGMEDGDIRHADHKWEPSETEWVEFINANSPHTRAVEFVSVGDKVKGIPCTLMAVFEKPGSGENSNGE